MKTPVLALLFCIAGWPAFAETIVPADAGAHVGETVTVKGVVSEVFTSSRSDTTFIDMGGRYPNNRFTGVIFSDSAGQFQNPAVLEDKTIEMTGKVRVYRGKPEIILDDAAQVKRD